MEYKGCGHCHECGHILLRQVETASGLGGEWCPDCAEIWRYGAHGFKGNVPQASTRAMKRRRSQCGIEPRHCEQCAELLTPTQEPEPYQSGLPMEEAEEEPSPQQSLWPS